VPLDSLVKMVHLVSMVPQEPLDLKEMLEHPDFREPQDSTAHLEKMVSVEHLAQSVPSVPPVSEPLVKMADPEHLDYLVPLARMASTALPACPVRTERLVSTALLVLPDLLEPLDWLDVPERTDSTEPLEPLVLPVPLVSLEHLVWLEHPVLPE